ncbi:DNA cytosine methyltransferase [Macrococcoides caseolyticum]|uniref:DNA cytosine methyltransferase n=1 Tax=Macrococcoides caseolyticum TaxID=69966 RepID=A0ACC9MRV1_9STAP|nr:DNA cytosine methyltransferase [Macrococcus caseolyticus]PKE39171.1 DNA cytosine methyltransferase [Macrococcus caseolyticus]PKE56217.1 DNA cytosine methyltransferase [Macrococcus caseolyticus]
MSNIISISLFSGAGGLDIGSCYAGVPVVFSTDIESDCIETLKLNDNYFENSEKLCGDLHKISSDYFEDIKKRYEDKKVIIIGGAPCQPFSKAGYWVGNNKRKGINDPRADLVNEYLRVVIDLMPDGFVFENVESLLHPTNREIAEKFIDIIAELGYEYKLIKANALDYGVSQKRKRIFIIGTKGTFRREEPVKTHTDKDKFPFSSLKNYVPVKEVINGFESDEFFEEYETIEGKTYENELKEIPPGMNYKALTEWANHPNPKFVADKRFWSFLLKLSPDKPSWTITAQPGPWVGPFHWDNRRLRVPEIAAIQSFPSDYKFYGSRRSIQKQIGNAVPPLMAKAMIEYLKESLEDE